MADIPFAIGGYQVRCPNLKKTRYEPASLEYQYLNGSLLYVGSPSITYTWDFLTDAEVASLRTVYDTLVGSVNPTTGAGTPVNVTVPDYKNGGFRTTTAYITEPTGTAGGDGTQGLSLIVYNLHEATLQTAMSAPAGNLWDTVSNGGNIQIGASNYTVTGWQF